MVQLPADFSRLPTFNHNPIDVRLETEMIAMIIKVCLTWIQFLHPILELEVRNVSELVEVMLLSC